MRAHALRQSAYVDRGSSRSTDPLPRRMIAAAVAVERFRLWRSSRPSGFLPGRSSPVPTLMLADHDGSEAHLVRQIPDVADCSPGESRTTRSERNRSSLNRQGGLTPDGTTLVTPDSLFESLGDDGSARRGEIMQAFVPLALVCERRLKTGHLSPAETWTLFRSEAQVRTEARVDPATRGGRGVRSAGLG